MDYQGAATAVARVERCEDGSAAELAEALRWRGQALIAAGEQPAGIDAFAVVATLVPAYALDPMISPKLHEAFAMGRARAATRKLVFARNLPSSIQGGAAAVAAEIFNPHGRAVRVAFEFTVLGKAVTVPATAEGNRHTARVPEGAVGTCRAVLRDAERVAFRTPEAPFVAAEVARDFPVVAAKQPTPPVEFVDEDLVKPAVAAPREPEHSGTKKGVPWQAWAAGGGALVVIAAVVAVIAVSAGRAEQCGSLGCWDVYPPAGQ